MEEPKISRLHVAVNDNRKDFYVYAWLRPCGTPFYIGKGRGNRDRQIKKKNKIFSGIVRQIEAEGGAPKIVRLFDSLTEREAFDLEVLQIAKYGRRADGTGILANMTNGGEGLSGWVADDSWRAKVSAANTGKRHSQETRLKLSIMRKGTKASAESREKMSVSHLERYKDPEARAKLSNIHIERLSSPEARLERKRIMGKPETREKLSRAAKERAASGEWSLSMRGLNKTPEARAKNAEAQLSLPPRGASGFKGVTKSGAKWRAKIVVRGDIRCLGTFASPEEAAAAYDKVAITLSPNAWLNFPLGGHELDGRRPPETHRKFGSPNKEVRKRTQQG